MNKRPLHNEEAQAMGVARASMSKLNSDTGNDTMNDMTHSTNAQDSQLPVIAGHEIAMDEHGRFNLNAIHRASGGQNEKRPSMWTRLNQAQELIAEMENQSTDLCLAPIESRRGGKTPGTYAHELLAVSYAGWISPRFQLQVNQVFLDYRMGKLNHQNNDTAEPKRIGKTTVKDRAPLKQLVNSIVDARTRKGLPSDYGTAWREVNSYVGVKSIEDATYEQVEQGIAFAKRILEGELIEPALPSPETTLSEEERQDLFLLCTHVGWLLHYWGKYRVETALRALESPAAAHLGEHLKVAALYGRRISEGQTDLMRVSSRRLGLDHLSLATL